MDRKRDDVGTIQTSIAIDAETHRQLTELARRGGMSMSAAATHAIAMLWANSSFYWNASKQTELSILAPVVVPDAKSPVQVAKPASSRQVVSIDESTSDRTRARYVAWVAGMVRRKVNELIERYGQNGQGSLKEVEFDLNRSVFWCAAYHDYLSEDFERAFSIAGQKCGLSPKMSLVIVQNAMSDSRQKHVDSKVPNINGAPKSPHDVLNISEGHDAAEASAKLINQLRGSRSSS